MKGTGAKRNVCPGSCASTGAKFPVAPVESAPMDNFTKCEPILKVFSPSYLVVNLQYIRV